MTDEFLSAKPKPRKQAWVVSTAYKPLRDETEPTVRMAPLFSHQPNSVYVRFDGPIRIDYEKRKQDYFVHKRDIDETYFRIKPKKIEQFYTELFRDARPHNALRACENLGKNITRKEYEKSVTGKFKIRVANFVPVEGHGARLKGTKSSNPPHESLKEGETSYVILYN